MCGWERRWVCGDMWELGGGVRSGGVMSGWERRWGWVCGDMWELGGGVRSGGVMSGWLEACFCVGGCSVWRCDWREGVCLVRC